MSNEVSPEHSRPSTRSTLLVVAVFAVILVGIWIHLYFRHIEATACTSHPDSSNLKTLTGNISQHPKHKIPYYLSSADQQVVLSNFRRQSTFNDILRNSIGKSASATFCGRELLSLDIEGMRVFTKDTSNGTLLLFGVIFILILGFIFVLFQYGHKKISFIK